MAVIINEFEVVVEPEETPEQAGAGVARQERPPQPLSPQDLYDVTRYQYERMMRLWAD